MHYWAYTALSALCVLLARLIISRQARTLPYPPGPPGWPIIGNTFEMPQGNIWQRFTALKERYGEIIFMKVLGKPLLVVNSFQVAQDLLEKRSSIYSDRPSLPMGGELCGFVNTVPMMPYDHRFREARKLLHQFMGTRTIVEKFASVIEKESAMFCSRLLSDLRPESLVQHTRKLAGSGILKLVYGYSLEGNDDPLVKQADLTIALYSDATVPGKYLADAIPWLRYLPSWLPGMGFKVHARTCRRELQKMFDEPLQWAWQNMDQDFDVQPFVKAHSATAAKDGGEDLLKLAAGSLYGGGADTTASAVHALFLLLAMFPDVQKKAQEEVDRVIGSERLPALHDRGRLPYVEALFLEVLRWTDITPTGVPHKLMEDDIYNGYVIPKGTIVIPNEHAMLHDPATYHDPWNMIPERFLSVDGKPAEQDPRSIVYGFGRRICPGRHIADMAIFLSCAMIVYAFDVSKAVVDGAVVEPVYATVGGLMTRPKEFKCSIKPRSDSVAALIQSSVKLKAGAHH